MDELILKLRTRDRKQDADLADEICRVFQDPTKIKSLTNGKDILVMTVSELSVCEDVCVRKKIVAILPKVLKYIESTGSVVDLWANQDFKNFFSLDSLFNTMIYGVMKTNDGSWVNAWEFVYDLIFHIKDVKKYSSESVLNLLLKTVEVAFKSKNKNILEQGFNCWKKIIDLFTNNTFELRLECRKLCFLLSKPLKVLKNPDSILPRIGVWIYLIEKYPIRQLPDDDFIEMVISPFISTLYSGETFNALYPNECCKALSNLLDLKTHLVIKYFPNIINIYPLVFKHKADENYDLQLKNKIHDFMKALKVFNKLKHEEFLEEIYKICQIDANECYLKDFMCLIQNQDCIQWIEDHDISEPLAKHIMGRKQFSVELKSWIESESFDRENWLSCSKLYIKWLASNPNLAEEDKTFIIAMLNFPFRKGFWKDQVVPKAWYSFVEALHSSGSFENFDSIFVEQLQNANSSPAASIEVLSFLSEKNKNVIKPALKFLEKFDTDPENSKMFSDMISYLDSICGHVPKNFILTVLGHLTPQIEKYDQRQQHKFKTKFSKLHRKLMALSDVKENVTEPQSPNKKRSPMTQSSFLQRLAKAKREGKLVSSCQEEINEMEKPETHTIAVNLEKENTTIIQDPVVQLFTPNKVKVTKTNGVLETPPSGKKNKIQAGMSLTPKSTPKQINYFDEDASDFVFVKTKPKTTPLTEHQKEMLSKRRADIPALYQDLSQDTQNLSSSILVTVTEATPPLNLKDPLQDVPTSAKKLDFDQINEKSPTVEDASIIEKKLEKTNEMVKEELSEAFPLDGIDSGIQKEEIEKKERKKRKSEPAKLSPKILRSKKLSLNENKKSLISKDNEIENQNNSSNKRELEEDENGVDKKLKIERDSNVSPSLQSQPRRRKQPRIIKAKSSPISSNNLEQWLLKISKNVVKTNVTNEVHIDEAQNINNPKVENTESLVISPKKTVSESQQEKSNSTHLTPTVNTNDLVKSSPIKNISPKKDELNSDNEKLEKDINDQKPSVTTPEKQSKMEQLKVIVSTTENTKDSVKPSPIKEKLSPKNNGHINSENQKLENGINDQIPSVTSTPENQSRMEQLKGKDLSPVVILYSPEKSLHNRRSQFMLKLLEDDKKAQFKTVTVEPEHKRNMRSSVGPTNSGRAAIILKKAKEFNGGTPSRAKRGNIEPVSFTENWPKGPQEKWVPYEPTPPGLSPGRSLLKSPLPRSTPKRCVNFLDPPTNKGLLFEHNGWDGQIFGPEIAVNDEPQAVEDSSSQQRVFKRDVSTPDRHSIFSLSEKKIEASTEKAQENCTEEKIEVKEDKINELEIKEDDSKKISNSSSSDSSNSESLDTTSDKKIDEIPVKKKRGRPFKVAKEVSVCEPNESSPIKTKLRSRSKSIEPETKKIRKIKEIGQNETEKIEKAVDINCCCSKRSHLKDFDMIKFKPANDVFSEHLNKTEILGVLAIFNVNTVADLVQLPCTKLYQLPLEEPKETTLINILEKYKLKFKDDNISPKFKSLLEDSELMEELSHPEKLTYLIAYLTQHSKYSEPWKTKAQEMNFNK